MLDFCLGLPAAALLGGGGLLAGLAGARGAALECVGAGLALGGLGAGSLRSHKGGRMNRPAIAGSAAVSVVLAARAGARWRGALVGGGQLAGGLCVLCSVLGLLFVRCWIYQQAGGVKEGGKAR